MADVKFSELSALAAPASADVLAIVDTDASTSKKITIDSLFGVVPVNIAVDDATDTTSATTGSIQTDGGIGAVKALWVGTTATAVGQVTSHAMSLRLGNAAGTTVDPAAPASDGWHRLHPQQHAPRRPQRSRLRASSRRKRSVQHRSQGSSQRHRACHAGWTWPASSPHLSG